MSTKTCATGNNLVLHKALNEGVHRIMATKRGHDLALGMDTPHMLLTDLHDDFYDFQCRLFESNQRGRSWQVFNFITIAVTNSDLADNKWL